MVYLVFGDLDFILKVIVLSAKILEPVDGGLPN